ncbi:NAD(P)-dependent oxidoreductase [Novosphingobium sp. RD2P27]|uniref:NAD(P)-dependent oxidoreductase n=1 Tax=Novosphingobium kalidii TaxID=3230299 RepID=A0ABV2D4Y4_9SPHN
MLIAVTGATGYVGSHVAPRLQAAGYALRLLMRHPEPAPMPGAETALLDLSNDITQGCLEGCDVLLHLAAYIPANLRDPASAEQCWRINARGTLKIAEAAARAGMRHMVHATSGNAYRFGDGSPRREDDAMMPTSRGFYLGSKLLQEIYANDMCERAGIGCATLRLGSVYGGPGATGLVPGFLNQLKAGKPVRLHGGGSFGADFVHVEDVAKAALLAIKDRTEGPLNVGSGERTTVRDLARTIADLCQAPDHLIEEGPSSASPDLGFAALDCSRLHALGYRPRALREGLMEALSPCEPTQTAR